MQINAAGLALIKEFEGLRLTAYPDPGTGGHPWTIGIGTTQYPNGRWVARGDTCTEAQALQYLQHDLQRFTREVERMVRVPVNENQFSALVSFAYNVGTEALRRSTLLRYLNEHRFADAAGEFGRWNQAAGKVLPGLVRRRAAERDLFLKPVASSAPAVPADPVITLPEPADEPVIEPAPEPVKPREWSFSMAPVVAALLPALINLLPELGKLFGNGPKTQQNIALAEKVAGIVTQATGSPNLQAAIESVQASPMQRQRAADALQSNWYELVEVGGGIQAAREFNQHVAALPAWRMPAIWVSGALLALVFMVVGTVLWADGWTPEIRLQVVTAVLTVIGMVGSFWLGTSASSQRKTDIMAEK